MRRLAVLGSTGSIGTQALDVVAASDGRFQVETLAAGTNVDALAVQVARFRPRAVCVADAASASALESRLHRSPGRPEVVHGRDGLERVATAEGVDLVVHGIVGAAGVAATAAAVDAGIDVALANKESLVAAGALITARARRSGARILPVDSEHNAIHQCLRGESTDEVRRLWLTASGGPFRDAPAEELDGVTPEQALRHPTWSMGPRITVDSATLMNKGFEVIEARWLFDIDPGRIRVVIHPESVVHSMVEFVDGSFKAQLGRTDMRHPIAYALDWPERRRTTLAPFRPGDPGAWHFEDPDPRRFPCLSLAYRALDAGGCAAAALNAADEVAVRAFLDRRLRFSDIPRVLSAVLDEIGAPEAHSVGTILEVDRAARDVARRRIELGAHP